MLYHVTGYKNVGDIERYGIRSNINGEIFVFDDVFEANSVAAYLFHRKYGLLQIDRRGIENLDIAGDEMIVRQPLIRPEWITLLAIRKTERSANALFCM